MMNTPTLIPLTHLTVLELTGEDAQTFLQAQVPSDVRLVTADHAQISGWCTAKGRLLTTFIILRSESDPNGFRLILASDVADTVAKRLKMFVLRLKVQITRLDDVVAGLLNPPPQLAHLNLPAEAWQVMHTPGLTAIRLDDTRILLTGTRDSLESETKGIATAPAEVWFRADIEQGFPLVTQATSELFVPQMVNLDKLGGVSFKKGCYPGQEIVARTHYLGKIKRHLYRIKASKPLTAGADVRSDVLNGQSGGSVLSTAPDESGQHWLALAVLQQDAANGANYVETDQGRVDLTLLDEVMPAPDAAPPA